MKINLFLKNCQTNFETEKGGKTSSSNFWRAFFQFRKYKLIEKEHEKIILDLESQKKDFYEESAKREKKKIRIYWARRD